MRHDHSKRMRIISAGGVAALAMLYAASAGAQAIMRTPTIRVDGATRIVTPAPVVAPRVNPGIAGGTVTSVGRTTSSLSGRLSPNPQFPTLRTAPNRYSLCRDDNSECNDTGTSSGGNGSASG